jgi:hypothetical protein
MRRGNDRHTSQVDNLADESHHPLQHQLGAERQGGLVAAHAAGSATTQNQGAFSHGWMFDA